MAVESDADRAALLNTADFGTVASNGNGSFNGIFGHKYIEQLDIDAESPTFLCADADVATYQVTKDSEIVIGATTYAARIIEPDGTGMSLLILEEQ